jgi:hypothetical protein
LILALLCFNIAFWLYIASGNKGWHFSFSFFFFFGEFSHPGDLRKVKWEYFIINFLFIKKFVNFFPKKIGKNIFTTS